MIEKSGRTKEISRDSQGPGAPTDGHESGGPSQRASLATDILTSLAHGDDYTVGGRRHPAIPLEHLGATLVRVGLEPPQGARACSIYESIVEALGKLDRSAGATPAGDRLATLIAPHLDALPLRDRLRSISALKTVAAWGDALERGEPAKSAVSRDEGSWSAHVICAALRVMALHEKRPIVQMVLQGVSVSVQQASQTVRTIHKPGELVARGGIRQSMEAHERAEVELFGRCYAAPDSCGVAPVIRRVSSDSVLVCEGESLRPVGYATVTQREHAPQASFSLGVVRELLDSAPSDWATSEDKAAWILGVHERIMRALARDTLDGVGGSEHLHPQSVAMWRRFCPSIDKLEVLKDFLSGWDARLDALAIGRISALKDSYTVWARKLGHFERDFKGELERCVSKGRMWWDQTRVEGTPLNRNTPQERSSCLIKKQASVDYPPLSAAEQPDLLNPKPSGWEWRTKISNTEGREWVADLLQQFSVETEVPRRAALMVEIVKVVEVAPEGEFPPDLVDRLRSFHDIYDRHEDRIEEQVADQEGPTSRVLMERAASLLEDLDDQAWRELRDSTVAALQHLEARVSSRLEMLDVRSFDLMAADPDLFPFTAIPLEVTDRDILEALGDPKFQSKDEVLESFRTDPKFQEQLRGLVLHRRDQKKVSVMMECLDDPEVRAIIERNLRIDLNTIPRASQIHLFRFLANYDESTLYFLRTALAKHHEIAPLIARSLIAYAQNEKAAMALLGLAVMLPKEELEITLHGFLRIVDAASSSKDEVVKLKLSPQDEATLLRHVERQTLERANSLLIDWEEMLRAYQGDTRGDTIPFVELARQVEGDSVVFAAIFKAAVSSHAIDPSKIGEISISYESVDSLSEEERERLATMQGYNGAKLYPAQFSAFLLHGLTDAMRDSRSRFWLLKINGTIEGFVRFEEQGPGRVYFGSLNLSPTVDSFGLGGIFLRETLNFEGDNKVVCGMVAADNPARNWFKRLGFKEGEAIENYDIGSTDGRPSGITGIPITWQPSRRHES